MHHRNYILYAAALVLCVLVSVPRAIPVAAFSYTTSSAAESTDTIADEVLEGSDETGEESTDTADDEYVAPIIYGEIKDGLFVRTFHEELATIEGGSSNPHYLEEYAKMVEARSLGALTPEMEADGGYYLVGDLVVMQADLDAVADEGEPGEGGNIVTQDEITENYGFVTIIAQVEDIIEESNQQCYVQLYNEETGEYFEFELFAINSYTTTGQRLPAGTYSVSYGGVPGDYKSEYLFKSLTDEFTIQAGGSATVRVQIGDVDGSQAARLEEQEAEKEEAAAEIIEEETEESGLNFAVIAIIIAVILILIVVGVIFVVKRAKENAWK